MEITKSILGWIMFLSLIAIPILIIKGVWVGFDSNLLKLIVSDIVIFVAALYISKVLFLKKLNKM